MASLLIRNQVEDHLLTPEEFRAYHHRLSTGSGNLCGLDGSTHVGRQHRCRAIMAGIKAIEESIKEA